MDPEWQWYQGRIQWCDGGHMGTGAAIPTMHGCSKRIVGHGGMGEFWVSMLLGEGLIPLPLFGGNFSHQHHNQPSTTQLTGFLLQASSSVFPRLAGPSSLLSSFSSSCFPDSSFLVPVLTKSQPSQERRGQRRYQGSRHLQPCRPPHPGQSGTGKPPQNLQVKKNITFACFARKNHLLTSRDHRAHGRVCFITKSIEY